LVEIITPECGLPYGVRLPYGVLNHTGKELHSLADHARSASWQLTL
jgi:hypothetical protein